ncbi:MAG: hypothetical protein ACYC3F_08860 [Gemmatimonadaceae bacterium]
MRSLLLGLIFAAVTAAPTASAQSTANIAGEWNATMNTPGGSRSFKIDFVQAGDSLSGMVRRATGDVPLQGKVKGNDVTFQYTIDYGGNALTLVVSTTVTGDTMKGAIDLGGVTETFSAERAPAAKPPVN